MIEEFNPSFVHISGPRNVVADALSRLDANFMEAGIEYDIFDEVRLTESSRDMEGLHAYDEHLEQSAGKSEETDVLYPVSAPVIGEYQQKDASHNYYEAVTN